MGRKRVAIYDNLALAKTLGEKIVYQPRGASRDLFHAQDDEVCLVGPAGTGKSLSCLHKMHLAMSKYKGAKSFMSRKTRVSMTNSCLDMFERHVLKPPDKVVFHKTDQQFNYPNGSLIAVIGFDEPTRMLSTDWDMGYVQEVTELNLNDWEIATTRLRNWIMPYQQIISDCNPDKPTHWMKLRIDKGLVKYLQSLHEDNPVLWHRRDGSDIGTRKCQKCIAGGKDAHWSTEGEKYLAKLMRLSGVRRSRYYAGEWVAAEGLVYDKWDSNVHMVNINDLPPNWDSWAHYWSIDWGFIHPFVWCDWVENPETGQMIRVREIYHTKLLVEDVAKYIKEQTAHYIPRAIICDHDAEDRAVFERHTGYFTLAAYKPIQQGVQAVQKRLDPEWCRQGPGVLYVRNAGLVLDQELKEAGLPTCSEDEYDGYVWDERIAKKANSKKDEIPVDKNNHGMDNTRYQVAFQDSLADDPQEWEGVMMLGDDDEVNISPY